MVPIIGAIRAFFKSITVHIDLRGLFGVMGLGVIGIIIGGLMNNNMVYSGGIFVVVFCGLLAALKFLV